MFLWVEQFVNHNLLFLYVIIAPTIEQITMITISNTGPGRTITASQEMVCANSPPPPKRKNNRAISMSNDMINVTMITSLLY